MIQAFRRAFRMRSPLEIATAELVEAQRSLLESETAREYAESLTDYHRKRIARLRVRIKDLSAEGEQA